MNERDFTRGIEVRMRVFVVHLPVSGPARVTDSVATAGRFLGHQFRQIANASGALPGLNVLAVNDGDPGRIIAAVFQTAETIEENGSRFRPTDVTDNSAH